MQSRKSKRTIKLAVTCQCQERAVSWPESELRKVQYRRCGKIFRTNRHEDFCFDCE
jgi:hypothetical protein